VHAEPVADMPEGWKHATDMRLRRGVWLRESTLGEPAVDPRRVALARPTRLRWLAGHRGPDGAWDAFDAVHGLPLDRALEPSPEWADVRWWLLDLARECVSQRPDEWRLRRADRVWVLHAGGAKLVDDPIADRAAGAEAGPPVTCAGFLDEVARKIRAQAVTPWPVGAHRFLEMLRANPAPEDAVVHAGLQPLVVQRATFGRSWQILSVGLVAAFPVLTAAMMVLGATVFLQQIRAIPDDLRVASSGLRRLASADRGLVTLSREDRRAIEVTLATRYRGALSDRELFDPRHFMLTMDDAHRRRAEDLLRRIDAATPSDAAFARPVVRDLIREATDDELQTSWWVAVGMVLGSMFLTAACGAMLSALAFRGAILRLMGFEIVRVDGRLASRLRTLLRAVLAWSPLLAAVPAAFVLAGAGVIPGSAELYASTMSVGLLVMAVLAAIPIARGGRGLHDRLAGTWVVPR
jgi:hypothetical protein